MLRRAWHLLLAISLLVTALFMPGCKRSDELGSSASKAENAPKTGNPKLESHLNRLITAYERGEAEAYAAPRDIEVLEGDRVRVSIKCVTGQVEAAARAVGTLGTVEIIVSRYDLIQAVVPIANLTALAEAESILRIRLPDQAVTGTTDE